MCEMYDMCDYSAGEMSGDHEPSDCGGKRSGHGPACIDDCFFGAATVGERGQVVIPAEARHKLGISPGDKLIIMRHPKFDGVMMLKLESMQGFMDEFMRRLATISNEPEEDNP